MRQWKNRFRAERIALVIVILVATMLPACAHQGSSGNENIDERVTVIIRPESTLEYAARLGICDFIHYTTIQGLGNHLAEQVHQELLQRQFVRSIERADRKIVSIDEGISVGREKGYDLILFGEVTEFIFGGLSTQSKVSLSLRIIDPQTTVTLWYVTGSLVDKPRQFLDLILIWRESKEAVSPYLLSGTLLKEILAVVASPGNGKIP